jgi:AraC-like DNA-binding protein
LIYLNAIHGMARNLTQRGGEGSGLVTPVIICVEVERPSGRLHKWEDAISAHIGQVHPTFHDQEALCALPVDNQPFVGRIEAGELGEMLLSKVATTKFRFARSLTTPTPTLPIPAMLVSVSRGRLQFVQRGRTCILARGDWTMIDTKQTHEYAIMSPELEARVMMLPRPSDREVVPLLERGLARRWSGRTGLSRVLHAMMDESLGEMRRLPRFSGRMLGAALSTMAWDALREQIETPPVVGHRDELSMRMKAYIEAELADPELSVEKIAHACMISVRGLHRLFDNDPAGSVSVYLWRRRLIRCAEALRDPNQVHRSITDICFSYGFSSTSHFSRLFKEQFGVPPVRYRVGPQERNQ